MKNSLIVIFFFVFIGACSTGQAQDFSRVRPYGKNPGWLKMFLYTPASLDSNVDIPVVVVLHGCLQNARKAAKQTGWNKLAEQYKFYVIYPQQRRRNNGMRCFCWFKRKDIDRGRGENYSVSNMVSYTREHYKIDSARIFVTGLSAGAGMGVTMMANYPEVFAAGAIFAGGPYRVATNLVNAMLSLPGWRIKKPSKWALYVRRQNPGFNGEYPRIMIYQGQNDPVVNKRNGIEIVKQWTSLHGIDTVPDEIINEYAGIRDISRMSYFNKNEEEVVVFYKIRNLGHALLVKPGECYNEGGATGFFARNKAYHSTYWSAVDFGLVPNPQISHKEIYSAKDTLMEFSVPDKKDLSYEWILPDSAQIIKGEKTANVQVRWGTRSGSVNAIATDTSGCKTIYKTLYVSPAN